MKILMIIWSDHSSHMRDQFEVISGIISVHINSPGAIPDMFFLGELVYKCVKSMLFLGFNTLEKKGCHFGVMSSDDCVKVLLFWGFSCHNIILFDLFVDVIKIPVSWKLIL